MLPVCPEVTPSAMAVAKRAGNASPFTVPGDCSPRSWAPPTKKNTGRAGPEQVKKKAGRRTPDDLADQRVVTAMAEPREETFRATLRTRTPDGAWATLIVTRQGRSTAARTWLTFDGASTTTAVLASEEAGQLIGQLGDASDAQPRRAAWEAAQDSSR